MNTTANKPDCIGHNAPVSCTATSANGKYFASGSYDSHICIWDANSHQLAYRFPTESLVNGIAFSPDETRIASGECDYNAYIRELSTGKILCQFKGHSDDINSVAWSPDGKKLATASFDDTARIWDTATGECLRSIAGHSDDVNGVSWSPDGNFIATASDDHTARIWNAESGELHVTLLDATDWCDHSPFSPDGTQIACSSMDGRARIYSVADGKLLLTLSQHGAAVKALCWNHRGDRICTASYDQTLREFDARSGKLLRSSKSVTMWSRFVSEIGTTDQYATGSFSGVPIVWSPEDEAREIAHQPTFGLNGASLSPDEQFVSMPCDDGYTRIYDLTNKQFTATLCGHEGPPICSRFSKSGKYLATGSWDSTVSIFQTSNWELVTHIRGANDIVCTLEFSADDTELITANYSGAIIRWDVHTGKILGVLTHHHGSAKGLCRGPKNSFLSGGRDGIIHRSHPSGFVEQWPVANTIINAIALSPDEKYYATASRDHCVRIHDASNGKELHCYQKHPCSVKTVDWSKDGKQVSAGYYDGAVLVWDPLQDESRIIFPVGEHSISETTFLSSGELLIGSWNPEGLAVISDIHGNPCSQFGYHCSL